MAPSARKAAFQRFLFVFKDDYSYCLEIGRYHRLRSSDGKSDGVNSTAVRLTAQLLLPQKLPAQTRRSDAGGEEGDPGRRRAPTVSRSNIRGVRGHRRLRRRLRDHQVLSAAV